MKIQRLSMLIALLPLLTQCAKEEEAPLAPANGMIASVDGSAWRSTATPGAAMGNGTLYISALGTGNTRISMILMGQTPGKYVVTGNQAGAFPENHVAYISTSSLPHVSGEMNANVVGDVTITDYDGLAMLISGTFQAEVRQPGGSTVQIKNGSFTKVKYVSSGLTANPEAFSSSAAATIQGNSLNPFCVVGVASYGKLSLELVGTSSRIFLSMPDTITPGNYSLGDAYSTYYAGFTKVGYSGTLYDVTLGNLEITEHDPVAKVITGTFSFDYTINQGSTGTLYLIRSGSLTITYK